MNGKIFHRIIIITVSFLKSGILYFISFEHLGSALFQTYDLFQNVISIVSIVEKIALQKYLQITKLIIGCSCYILEIGFKSNISIIQKNSTLKDVINWVPVAHTCNQNYLGG
jgi:hypothetical protein